MLPVDQARSRTCRHAQVARATRGARPGECYPQMPETSVLTEPEIVALHTVPRLEFPGSVEHVDQAQNVGRTLHTVPVDVGSLIR